MKRRKINLSAVILWSVVAYAIALLTYCTMNNFLKSSAEDISAFGSILGACGAFFAAFVATYLFNDWKEQKSFENKIHFINNTIESGEQFLVQMILVAVLISKIKNSCTLIQNSGPNERVNIESIKGLKEDLFSTNMEYLKLLNTFIFNLQRFQKFSGYKKIEEFIEKLLEKIKLIDDRLAKYYIDEDLPSLHESSKDSLKFMSQLKRFLEQELIPYLDECKTP